MKDERPPEGLLLVDKPTGPTSHDLVRAVRRALGEKRVGHTGTLDPFASGLLLLLVGRATRLAEYLDGHAKAYRATVVLGRTTTTDDPEGETLSEDDGWRSLGRADVEEAAASFQGRLRQTPPAYSAKKVGGEAAYRKARRGEEVELPPVEVEVREIAVRSFDPPRVTLDVECSTGTYIRALARDLGHRLGVGAYLEVLRRTAVGSFRVEDALPFEDLEDPDRVRKKLIPPAGALAHLPSVSLEGADVHRFVQGQALPLDAFRPAALPTGGGAVGSATRGGAGDPAREGGTEGAPSPEGPPSPEGRPSPSPGTPASPESPVPPGEPTSLPENGPVAVLRDGELLGVAIRREAVLRPRKVLQRA